MNTFSARLTTVFFAALLTGCTTAPKSSPIVLIDQFPIGFVAGNDADLLLLAVYETDHLTIDRVRVSRLSKVLAGKVAIPRTSKKKRLKDLLIFSSESRLLYLTRLTGQGHFAGRLDIPLDTRSRSTLQDVFGDADIRSVDLTDFSAALPRRMVRLALTPKERQTVVTFVRRMHQM